MRPKQGWAVGIIISFLIILFHIFAASTVIPLETIKRTLITYLIMMLTGISCGLIGEYIGKRLRNKKNID